MGKETSGYRVLYIQASPDDLRFYSGCHMLEKNDLLNVRNHIKDNLEEFNNLVTDTSFTQVFGEVHGERHKRLAPEFAEIAETQPLIANKGFYYFKKYEPGVILEEDLIGKLVEDYKVGKPLGQFLTRGILGN